MLIVKANKSINDREARFNKMMYEFKGKVYNTKLIKECYQRKFYVSPSEAKNQSREQVKCQNRWFKNHPEE